jgi:LacI family transcriptional regulator
VALVVNEIARERRAALADGYVAMVIATPLERLCRDLVGLMVQALQNGTTPVPGQHFLRPDLYLPESV